MDDLETVKQLVSSLQSATTDLEGTLEEKLLSTGLAEQVQQITDPLEKVQLYNTYAYVIASLYFSYLKASGKNTKNDHPVMQELGRVKSYMERAKKAGLKDEGGQSRKQASTEEAQQFVRSQLGEPAVSRVHFEGKHTKFEQEKGETPKRASTKGGSTKGVSKPTRRKSSKSKTS